MQRSVVHFAIFSALAFNCSRCLQKVCMMGQGAPTNTIATNGSLAGKKEGESEWDPTIAIATLDAP